MIPAVPAHGRNDAGRVRRMSDMAKQKCPFCGDMMSEVSRDEEFGIQEPQISIVFHCPKCGREPMMILEKEGYYDEDDNPVEEHP